MKRPAPDDDNHAGQSAKRAKLDTKAQDDVNLQAKNRRCPREVVYAIEQGQRLPGVKGHLQGIAQKWTCLPQGLGFGFSVPAEGKKNKKDKINFEVNVVGPGEDILKGWKVNNKDEILLSLRGAALTSLAKPKAGGATHRIIFRTGIHLKWKDQELNAFGSQSNLSSPTY